MNVYTVVSDRENIFDVGERFSKSDIADWLKDNSLSTGMILLGPEGYRKVVKHNGKQSLEECAADGSRAASTLTMQIFDFVAQHQADPPSLREIGSAFGIVVSHVSYCLGALEREGLIMRTKHLSRSIRLTLLGHELWDKRK